MDSSLPCSPGSGKASDANATSPESLSRPEGSRSIRRTDRDVDQGASEEARIAALATDDTSCADTEPLVASGSHQTPVDAVDVSSTDQKATAKSAVGKSTGKSTGKSAVGKSTRLKTKPAADVTSKREADKVSTDGRPSEARPSGTKISATQDSIGAETADPSLTATSSGHRFLFFAAIPSWLVSMIVHIVLLFCLALLTLPKIKQERDNEILLGDAETTQIEDSPIFEASKPEDMENLELSDLAPTDPVNVQPTELEADVPDVFSADDLEAATSFTELDPLGSDVAPKSDLLRQIGTFSGAGLEGRGKASRARLVREGGGTEGSEKAVQLALKWLQQHQNPNGSWSFQHLAGNCPCRDRGSLDAAYNGATAMALLPFLGAGHTHKEGQYQREVQAGLYFLLGRQQRNGAFIESGGNLYSHGLCAIALSEAFAMTQDQTLMRPAQAALDYIAYAQDPVGGGWRYVARQPGDTSVVGWQLMALKSGRMAYLHVDPSVFQGATKFLDSVQADQGAAYGYKDPGRKPSTTAIGLLCRMYLGWERNHPALRTGVERIGKSGPSTNDMYYNYYATQVMRHYEGDAWTEWNEKMREFLVKNQAKNGHETGSWYMGNNHSSISGGRLYCTSMATMILEVYYRHLPIYQKQATEDDFEL